MKKLNWNKLPDLKVKGTIWEKDAVDSKVDLNTSELEALFGAQGSGSGGGVSASGKAKPEPKETKPAAVTVIDPKRAQSVNLVLAKLVQARLDQPTVIRALVEGDLTMLDNAKMPIPDVLNLLLNTLPSPDEVQLLDDCHEPRQSMGDVEQWMLMLKEKVPQFQARTTALVARSSFSESYGEKYRIVSTVLETAKQIKSSKALVRLLQQTLAIGNYLNGTSRNGGAYGFKLNVLTDLASCKTTDGKSTLLHYLAKNTAKMGTGGAPLIDTVKKELSAMDAPLRFEWAAVSAEVDILSSSVRRIETLVASDKVAAFTASMGTFLQEAKAKMDALSKMKAEVNQLCLDLGTWFAEQKVDKEPEKFFALIGTFVKTLENADKYNREAVERDEKQRKRQETAAKEAEEAKNRPKKSAQATAAVVDEASFRTALASRRRFVEDLEAGIAEGRVQRHRASVAADGMVGL